MTMVSDLVLILGGGGGMLAAQWGVAFFKSRSDDRRTDRNADMRVEEHRDSMTIRLLEHTQDYLSKMKQELDELRPLQARIAHLEEALDHVHALLHAETPEERTAAERRAKAFLRRMRPEVGDLRNAVQKVRSTKAVKKIIEDEQA